ncbi:MAG: hypothetical protein J2P54_05525 [Bradyrhizobiaceae bacterium]|nr:hypothetical protein [Bradyrhizobiaceae bacterium]
MFAHEVRHSVYEAAQNAPEERLQEEIAPC